MYNQNYQNRNNEPRNDNEPGYIYMMEAIGYHGILPGYYIRRCKIGLSRNPEFRLANFYANQPPCDIRILRTIYVEDMQAVESQLHEQFRNCKVKLTKSREWFDFGPLEMMKVHWLFARYDQAINVRIPLVSRPSFAKFLILSGLGLLLFTAISGQFQQPQSQQPHNAVKMGKRSQSAFYRHAFSKNLTQTRF